MNRTTKLLGILSGAIIFFAGTLLEAEGKDQRPNVLLILADDMGWGVASIHYQGRRDIIRVRTGEGSRALHGRADIAFRSLLSGREG